VNLVFQAVTALVGQAVQQQNVQANSSNFNTAVAPTATPFR
jgi:hypothetical protein